MPYDLVVIGASLGGLEAVSNLLEALPAGVFPADRHRPAPGRLAAGDGDLAALWQRHTLAPGP